MCSLKKGKHQAEILLFKGSNACWLKIPLDGLCCCYAACCHFKQNSSLTAPSSRKAARDFPKVDRTELLPSANYGDLRNSIDPVGHTQAT